MNTKEESTNRAIGSKKGLKYLKKPATLYACCGLLGLIALIFLYRPLLIKLQEAAGRLRDVETELLNQRSAISSLPESNLGTKIMPRDEVPLTIADLTEKGRELGLDFGSISPGALVETTQAGIGKLPISFAIESEYKNVGQFLAYVEEYPRSVTEVTSLSIRAREETLSKLDVQLAINLCVEIENATQ